MCSFSTDIWRSAILQDMPGITFDAFDGDAPIGIGQVFGLLPTRARSFTWRASSWFEAVPSPAMEHLVAVVHGLADEEAEIPLDVLAQFLASDVQVIDGELRGFDDGTNQLDFIIRSVRGDEWDIEARNPEELDRIGAQIRSWRPHPQPILSAAFAHSTACAFVRLHGNRGDLGTAWF